MTSGWSVTLTGALLSGSDAAAAWPQVAELLDMEVATLRARLPLTLAATDETEARRQVDGLEVCGVTVRLLPDAGEPRLWLHQGGTTQGPVSDEYVHAVHADASLGDDIQVCVQGRGHWQPAGEFLRAASTAPDYRLDDVAGPPPVTPASPPPPPARATAAADNRLGDDGKLLPHARMPGLHAGFWTRFGAFVIDWLIVTTGTYVLMVVVVGMVMLMVPSAAKDDSTAKLIGLLFFLTGAVVVWLYHALFESSSRQATPGKMALGLGVTDMAGRRIGFGRASGRFVARILSGLTLYIGYMMAGWTERKQALHGMVAGCCVVHARNLNPPAGSVPRQRPPRAEPVATTSTAASRFAPAPRRGLPIWAIVLIVAGCVLMPIGILAAIAVPAYQSYVVRTQITAGMPLADEAKAAVTKYALRTGKMPANNLALGLGNSKATHGRYVSAVDVRHGKVVLTYGGPDAGDHVLGGHLFLTPHRVDYGLHWACRSPDIKDRYLPRQCQEKP